jgi:hypothetical protein
VAVGEVVTLPTLQPPLGSFLLGSAVTVPTRSDSGATGTVSVADLAGQFSFDLAGPGAPSADLWTTPVRFAGDSSAVTLVAIAVASDTVTLTYVPGATPGATAPVVYFGNYPLDGSTAVCYTC